ncbi:MAG TPA: hypothetical protein VMN78_08955 [Longimicrobiales bacterium]|nr:hypothetical protein [Longimicrobiales bacterium]
MTIRGWAPVLAMAGVLAGCGDDDGTDPDLPDLTRADVAGVYDMTRLTFDPQGSLPLVDLLDRLDPTDLPDLRISSTEDSLQLTFTDPDGGLLRIVDGSYQLRDDGILVSLEDSPDPAKLLLPRHIEYAFDENEETLAFTGAVSADTARLFVLVPEWSGEPVTSPLPGTLGVTFRRN